eukprot:9497302-Pyramimonas_sp.AAC.1
MLGTPAVMLHPSPPHGAPCSPELFDTATGSKPARHARGSTVGYAPVHVRGGRAEPTSLLVVHMPTIHEFLCSRPGQGRCNHGGRHRGMPGSEEERRWTPSRANVFPLKLCEFLGACLLQQVRSAFPDSVASHCPLPSPRLHPVRQPLEWRWNRERQLRRFINLDPCDDQWAVPQGLR